MLRVEPAWQPAVRGNTCVVLVSGVHRSSLEAIAFAKRLRPDNLVCATVCDAEQAEHIREDWARFEVDAELEVVDSPYRELAGPLLRFLDELSARHPENDMTVILPELVVDRWWEHLLHNQSALALKARLLFRPRTIVISVPLHLNPKFHEVAPEAGEPGAPPQLSEEEAVRL